MHGHMDVKYILYVWKHLPVLFYDLLDKYNQVTKFPKYVIKNIA
jgi:hypothetical protein